MQEKTDQKGYDLRAESKDFAIRSIKLYQYLTEPKDAQASNGKNVKREYNLSKQFLMAATRIGDLIRQENPQDAFYAAKSAKYWLELLKGGGYLTDDEAESMINDCLPLIKILYVIVHPESRKDNKEQKGGAL